MPPGIFNYARGYWHVENSHLLLQSDMINCFWFCLLMIILCCISVNCDVYSCNAKCSHVKVIGKEKILPPRKPLKQCHAKVIATPPYSKENETTASSPKWQKVSWYTYKRSNNKSYIALNLTWQQDIQEFVTGYYLTITPSRSFVSVKRKFTFKFKQKTGPVIFNYACFGMRNNEEIRPNKLYLLVLMALPMYHENSDMLRDSWTISIPDCSNKRLFQTHDCVQERMWSDESVDEFVENADDEDYVQRESRNDNLREDLISSVKVKPLNVTTVITIVVVCCIFLLITICVIVLACKRRQRTSSDCGFKSVLMLVFQAEKSDLYFDISSRIASMLKKYGELEVSFNLWSMSKMKDAFQWFNDNKQCDHIVLVCTPEGKKNCDRLTQDALKDPFMIGLNQFKKEIQRTLWWWPKQHTFSCIYFEEKPESSIPNIIKQHKNNITIYRMREDYDKFFHQLTGRYIGAVPKEYIHNVFSKLKVCSNDRNIEQFHDNRDNLENINGAKVISESAVYFSTSSDASNLTNTSDSSSCETCHTNTTHLVSGVTAVIDDLITEIPQ
ncbi:unnamed protein product [Clavelina lepadiformis]|uniref:SEFIR domain-containing protein n=1 Tax=Clavelina lepadiformis TaxID=159417 RepID=A0ABP0H0H1_CLALP